MLKSVIAAAMVAAAAGSSFAADQADRAGAPVYDLEFTAIDGSPMPLSRFAGRVVLFVNTASLCGFTPQYQQLQALWARYRDEGLVVIGAPSDDFGGQELGSRREIKTFCEVNFGIDFPMTDKIPVTGDDAHPFYSLVDRALGAEALPRWNFHKILISRRGDIVGFFPTSVRPDAPDVISAIEARLAESAN